ncbi:MAG: arsenic resistance N-acetyltransferase ArsN2 [Paludibacter sp.]|nr:arsenic resistance N-acetyltransferase ArsN2 [Paludibacter sp.]
MISEDEKKLLHERYAELAKKSLIRTQYSCGGNSTGIDEPDYVPIVPEVPFEKNILYTIAREEDMKAIIELLKTNNLPTTDLNTGQRTFIVALSDGKVIGCVALESYNDAGLLRSLVVNNDFRAKSIGQKLVFEAEVLNNKLKNLYLLTTTAAGFFLKIGWKNTERTSVPESIARSDEFASICPSTAICMTKPLE